MKLIVLILIFVSPLMAKPQPGDFFTRGPKREKKLALTFDDGPGHQTKDFLDLLDLYNVKATFFMLGDQARLNPKSAYEVARRGHEIGNHTWRHTNYKLRLREIQKELGPKTKKKKALQAAKEELKEDLKKTNRILSELTFVQPKLVRMPHGIDRKWISDVAKEEGLILVNWTYGADWTDQGFELLKNTYLSAIKPGAILLFHDGPGGREKSLRLAKEVIRSAMKQGYELIPVGQLIGLTSP